MTSPDNNLAKTVGHGHHWPAELLLFRAATTTQLLEQMQQQRWLLTRNATTDLAQLAAACWRRAYYGLSDARAAGGADWQPTVAIVACTTAEALEKLALACKLLAEASYSSTSRRSPRPDIWLQRAQRAVTAQGIFFAEEPLLPDGKLAVLFPGQGIHGPGMLGQLASVFPELRESMQRADRLLEGRIAKPLSGYVCAGPQITADQRRQWAELFRRSELTLPLIAAACTGLFRVLRRLGLRPDMLAGHSFGEHVALCAAGAIDYDDLILLAYRRGLALMDAARCSPGGMLAVAADADRCRRLLAGCCEVAIANINAPRQVVIAATEDSLLRACQVCDANRIATERLDVAGPFHCWLMSSARPAIAHALQQCHVGGMAVPVWSNITAAPMPSDPVQIKRILLEHTTAPVRFAEQIENMYAAGARVFVEVGPQNVLCRLVKRILRGRPHLTVATHINGRDELVQWQRALGQLLTAGVRLRLERLEWLRGT